MFQDLQQHFGLLVVGRGESLKWEAPAAKALATKSTGGFANGVGSSRMAREIREFGRPPGAA
jgi:hypothetical protein